MPPTPRRHSLTFNQANLKNYLRTDRRPTVRYVQTTILIFGNWKELHCSSCEPYWLRYFIDFDEGNAGGIAGARHFYRVGARRQHDENRRVRARRIKQGERTHRIAGVAQLRITTPASVDRDHGVLTTRSWT